MSAAATTRPAHGLPDPASIQELAAALHPSAHASRRRHLAPLLAALSAIGPFSTDAYLPSFQEIARVFGAPEVLVQQTLTAYMVPFTAMTLWHGAISDARGRRRVVILTLSLFALASLGCMLSWNIEALLLFRGLQGMTAGAGMVIGRAIVRDVLEGDDARRLMAQVALVFAIAPSIGPLVGGWLHVWFGWRSVFGFLVLFALALVAWCWAALPETLAPRDRRPFEVASMAGQYWRVLSSPPFLALVTALTLSFSAAFLYIVSAPTFLVVHLQVPETAFLWLFGPISLGMLVGTWISGLLPGRISNRRSVLLAYAIMGTAAGANVLYHLVAAPALPWSVAPVALYFVGTSVAMPSLTLMALELFPDRRGLAASCQAFLQMCGNTLVTAMLAPLLWGSALTLAMGMAGLLAIGAGVFLAWARWLQGAPRIAAG